MDLLADLVTTDSPEAPVLKAKLEHLVSPAALVEMDALVPQALNPAQSDLKDQLEPQASTALLAKTAFLADQELQAKTDFQAALVSQVFRFLYLFDIMFIIYHFYVKFQVVPDNQVNLARMVSMDLQEHLASLVAQDL